MQLPAMQSTARSTGLSTGAPVLAVESLSPSPSPSSAQARLASKISVAAANGVWGAHQSSAWTDDSKAHPLASMALSSRSSSKKMNSATAPASPARTRKKGTGFIMC